LCGDGRLRPSSERSERGFGWLPRRGWFARAKVPAPHKTILVISSSGVARSVPNVVWREELKTRSHWKPDLRVTKARD
jgi:hypothetical protein